MREPGGDEEILINFSCIPFALQLSGLFRSTGSRRRLESTLNFNSHCWGESEMKRKMSKHKSTFHKTKFLAPRCNHKKDELAKPETERKSETKNRRGGGVVAGEKGLCLICGQELNEITVAFVFCIYELEALGWKKGISSILF